MIAGLKRDLAQWVASHALVKDAEHPIESLLRGLLPDDQPLVREIRFHLARPAHLEVLAAGEVERSLEIPLGFAPWIAGFLEVRCALAEAAVTRPSIMLKPVSRDFVFERSGSPLRFRVRRRGSE